MTEVVVSNRECGETKTEPSESGVWIFVLGDMLVFALFFAVFLFARLQNPEIFLESRTQLNQVLGALNTLILLSSSFFAVITLHLYRKGQDILSVTDSSTNIAKVEFEVAKSKVKLFARLTLACGIGFLIIKSYEYGEKFAAGINIATNEFYLYYFAFTGFHLVHVTVGVLVFYSVVKIALDQLGGEDHTQSVEGAAIYWHMVDVLWIVLFVLFYLVR